MLEWVKQVMDFLGYPGIAFLMFLENIVPPIPSELIMPLAGFLSVQGDFNFAGVVIAGTLGSVLGALPLYYLGALAGEQRLKRWADRYGRWLISAADVDKAKVWFDRYGAIAVFFCRLVPGIRSLISIPAGMAHMPLLPFLLYTTTGSALWTILLAGAGWLLGENYKTVEDYIGPISTGVLIGCVVIAFGTLFYRWQRRTAQ